MWMGTLHVFMFETGGHAPSDPGLAVCWRDTAPVYIQSRLHRSEL